MNIGLIIYGSLGTLSGGYMYDRKLVEYLRGRGDSVEIISLPWRNYAAHLTDNLRFRLPSNLDILIQDELNHPSLIAANRGQHPYPIVSLVHHLRSSERRPAWQNTFYGVLERLYLTSVDGFIFNSKTTERVVTGMVASRKPGLVAYPPTDRFGEPVSENEIVQRVRHSGLRILFVGNVIYRKGLHTLLQAVHSLPPPFRVDVVGSLETEPRYARRMQEFVRENHLFSSIHFHGPLDQEPLAGKLRQAHLLVVPSSYEGFGIVYLEGMGFGLPAIGTTAGAAGEIIEHGRTGYLVAPEDPAALAAHLHSLVEDRGLLERLSLNARERYLQQPPWTETAESIRNFLFSLVN